MKLSFPKRSITTHDTEQKVIQQFLWWKRLSHSQKLTFATFLFLLLVLPVLVWASYQYQQTRSRAATTPVTPPTTPPNLIPTTTPVSFGKALQFVDNNQPYSPVSIKVNGPSWMYFDSKWTIEGWFKRSSKDSSKRYLLYAPLAFGSIQLYLDNYYLKAVFPYKPSPTSQPGLMLNAGFIDTNWHHLAITSDGDSCAMYVDGKQKAVSAKGVCKKIRDHDFDISGNILIGHRFYQSSPVSYEGYNGIIDEFRINTSSALYTSSFTPPSVPFPDESGEILYHFNKINGSNIESSGKYKDAGSVSPVTRVAYVQSSITFPTPTTVPTMTTTSPQPLLKITAPNGGEQLTVGQLFTITWNSSRTFDKIDLRYVTGNGYPNTIAQNIADTGKFDWQINTLYPTENDYIVYIYGYSESYMTANDRSDDYFTILPSTTVYPTPSPFLTTTPTRAPSPHPTTIPACRNTDLNKDGVVDQKDVQILLADYWSANPQNIRSDINRDGIVDLTDYSLMVIDYGRSIGRCL